MNLKLKSITLFLIIASATLLVNVKPAFSATLLSIEPAIVYALPDETFKVNVTTDDVRYLYAWQVNLTFNPSVIEYVNVTEGEFLKDTPGGTASFKRIDKAALGWIFFGWTMQGTYQGHSGSGTLATVEFRVLTEGESKIKVRTEPVWIDEDEDGEVDPDEFMSPTRLRSQSSTVDIPVWGWITFTTMNSFFFNLEVPPTADFTYSPIAPGINQTVTFDASASSATPPRNITEYFWDFGDETNGTGQTIDHNFTTGGVYTVSLTVFDDAPATALVQEAFNTTTMPRIWYELHSTKTVEIGVAFVHDIAVTYVEASKDDVTVGETVSLNVTVRNNGLTAESFNVTAYYGDNTIEKRPVLDMSNGTVQTLIFDWDTTGVSAGSYKISAEATDVEGESFLGNNKFVDGTVKILAAAESFPITLVAGAAVVVVALIVVVFWFLRKRGSPKTT